MSLAVRLAALGQACPRVAVVEKRPRYEHDRTWSGWRGSGSRRPHQARRDWNEVVVTAGGRSVRVDCAAMPYQSIDSGTFYAEAEAGIRANDRLRLLLGEPVTDPPARLDGVWRVRTTARELVSPAVVDTRPGLQGGARPPRLWQSFSGVEVECPMGTFDPARAVLMDFMDEPGLPVAFLYLLPYSSSRALVEATVFSPRKLDEGALAPMLARLLAKVSPAETPRVVHREHHAIPMGLDAIDSFPMEGYVRVGLEAGAARASTGYAFQRIQRWADEAVECIAHGRRVRPLAADPWIVRRMDDLFLRVLARAPERAPELFLRLFSRRDPRPVLRFLNDEARPLDYLAVMRALPAGLFLREVFRGLLP